VQAAARRYFDTKNYVQVVLNPEAAAKAANVAKALPAAQPGQPGQSTLPGT
jgi:zinc protease